jgi:hypothetical protein
LIALFDLLYIEAAMKIAGAVPPRNEAPRFVSTAQGFAERGDWSRAKEFFAMGIDLDPKRAETWIARGRAQAERGEHQLSEADLGQAAALATGELHKFIEAGWWVAGPYPEDLAASCPPEQMADPSRPLTPHVGGNTLSAADGQSGVMWQRAPSSMLGHVSLSTLFPNARNLSCYLLTYLASPDEREVTLLVGSDGPRRVWLNGVLVHESTDPAVWGFGLKRVRLRLPAGRSTLLIKASHVTGSYLVGCRLHDSLVDRAVALTERRRFADATPLWVQLHGQAPESFTDRCTALCAAAAGDESAYEIACERLRQRYAATNNTSGAYALVLGYVGLAMSMRLRSTSMRARRSPCSSIRPAWPCKRSTAVWATPESTSAR